MKKFLAAAAASLILFSASAEAGGGVTGIIKLQPDMGLTVMASNGGRGSGDKGSAGVGWSVGGEKRKSKRFIRIHLISCSEDLKSLSNAEIEAWYKDGIAPADRDVFLVSADSDGKYEISDVPAGEYFFVIVTNAINERDMAPKMSKVDEEFRAFIPSWDSFQLFAVGMNQYVVQKVKTTDGALTRLDYDFAAPPFSEK